MMDRWDIAANYEIYDQLPASVRRAIQEATIVMSMSAVQNAYNNGGVPGALKLIELANKAAMGYANIRGLPMHARLRANWK